MISTGQPVVPDVVNQSQAAAEDAIALVPGLSVGAVNQACNDTVALGNVISQSPAGGTTVGCGASVSLVISTGPCITVPDVVNQSQSAAEAAITAAGLTVGTVTSQC
ncbi:MAG: PASTA domain-containing protein, partial [Bryobacteraceae bacterium]